MSSLLIDSLSPIQRCPLDVLGEIIGHLPEYCPFCLRMLSSNFFHTTNRSRLWTGYQLLVRTDRDVHALRTWFSRSGSLPLGLSIESATDDYRTWSQLYYYLDSIAHRLESVYISINFHQCHSMFYSLSCMQNLVHLSISIDHQPAYMSWQPVFDLSSVLTIRYARLFQCVINPESQTLCVKLAWDKLILLHLEDLQLSLHGAANILAACTSLQRCYLISHTPERLLPQYSPSIVHMESFRDMKELIISGSSSVDVILVPNRFPNLEILCLDLGPHPEGPFQPPALHHYFAQNPPPLKSLYVCFSGTWLERHFRAIIPGLTTLKILALSCRSSTAVSHPRQTLLQLSSGIWDSLPTLRELHVDTPTTRDDRYTYLHSCIVDGLPHYTSSPAGSSLTIDCSTHPLDYASHTPLQKFFWQHVHKSPITSIHQSYPPMRSDYLHCWCPYKG
ncbi:hypothetical protein BDN72DRAFT_901260 [Pluteus cervinus]|uniref:Uncharacterized protein n=1 Tax=Pluteus cervinus TaxID=181527 RepID=A0ACD3AGZ4_9AGAR|nr:hypothetical protein BDN72DRAFT_901260 [Pluteus cervinus]